MNPITSILVIVDPTASVHPAVSKGATLAKALDARMELYACDTKAARETRLTARAGAHPSAAGPTSLKPMLEALAQPLRQQGLDVSTDVEAGDPLPERLIARVKRTTADLVVKDTHHHSLAKRTFLTNTDWQLIRLCPTPLLLTKAAPWAKTPRIVAAVDPGHVNDKPALLDTRILEYASCIARRLHGELHVLHAYVPVAVIAAAVGIDPPSALNLSAEELVREKQARFDEVVTGAQPFGVDASRIHVQPGAPAQLLPHAASELLADIVAMGAISRGGLQRVFLGSTAEDVLEHLPCDALIVKPPDFSAALSSWC